MLGWCNCPAGWGGDDCSTRVKRLCSQHNRGLPGFEPYDEPINWEQGRKTLGCAGYCDTGEHEGCVQPRCKDLQPEGKSPRRRCRHGILLLPIRHALRAAAARTCWAYRRAAPARGAAHGPSVPADAGVRCCRCCCCSAQWVVAARPCWRHHDPLLVCAQTPEGKKARNWGDVPRDFLFNWVVCCGESELAVRLPL